MTGEQLKTLLNTKGLTQTKVAEILGIPQQGLNKKFGSDSIKTTLLENLCDKLCVDMYYFYGGTKYLPVEKINNDPQAVEKRLYDELLKELFTCKIQIGELQKEIEILKAEKEPDGSKPQKDAV